MKAKKSSKPGVKVTQDRQALLSIQEVLDGTEWSVEMLETIADVLRLAGYQVRECE